MCEWDFSFCSVDFSKQNDVINNGFSAALTAQTDEEIERGTDSIPTKGNTNHILYILNVCVCV